MFAPKKMPLRPIRTKREHQTALKEAEALWDAPEGSPKADRLEVLNRVRPLSLEMIRRLAQGLTLPADVLIRGYDIKRAA